MPLSGATCFFYVLLLSTFVGIFGCDAPERSLENFPNRNDTARIDSVGQYIVITALSDSSSLATATLFVKESLAWKITKRFPVQLGKNGLGWGMGLHSDSLRPTAFPMKFEGDLKAPAGIFKIGTTFGKADAMQTEFPYLQVTADIMCIEDRMSSSYNRIIENGVDSSDWNSTDIMLRKDSLYDAGFFVEHNMRQIPGRGSCIFFHIWRSPNSGTAGCTAMSRENIFSLLEWIQPELNPRVVQGTPEILQIFHEEYGIPIPN